MPVRVLPRRPRAGRHHGAPPISRVDAIHAVTNPRSIYTAAIHVYGGDYFGTARSQWDPDTLQEAPFDVGNVQRVMTRADDEVRSVP